jgi:ATP-dependent exoDNAse (exonuclease V) beta subunit
MQWQNFSIRDNSITSDNTSFTIVGDPKQSIYRFRGGESELMLNIINQETTPKKQPLNTSDSIGEVRRILSISIIGCMILCLRL